MQQKNGKKITSPVLAGLSGLERDTMMAQLLASDILLKRINELISKEIEGLGNITPEAFDTPSWAYKQAYELGMKRGLQRLKEITKVNGL